MRVIVFIEVEYKRLQWQLKNSVDESIFDEKVSEKALVCKGCDLGYDADAEVLLRKGQDLCMFRVEFSLVLCKPVILWYGPRRY